MDSKISESLDLGYSWTRKIPLFRCDYLQISIYDPIGTAFYRGAEACLLIFDITNSDSFQKIGWLKNYFLEHGPFWEPDTFPIVLIGLNSSPFWPQCNSWKGNKVDREEERQVSTAEVQAWCRANGGILYFEVSAKDNVMIEDVFQGIAETMHDRRIRQDKESIT